MTYNEQTDDREKKVVLEETEAKQGLELHEMRYVLAFGTAGAVVALGIVGFLLI